jgi:hypothetical protein
MNYFNHNITRKYVAIFGSLFDGIKIKKDSKDFIVPISYAKKDKLIQRALRRDESLKGVSMTLKRMAFEFTEFYYDGERKLNRLNKIVGIDETDGERYNQFTPVPYNLTAELSIIANKNDDITQIVEQILPQFTPDIKITANLITELEHYFDLSFNLNSVYVQDLYEGLIEQKRIIIYGLNFTLKGYYFGELYKDKPINTVIGNISTNFYGFDASESETVTITEEDL